MMHKQPDCGTSFYSFPVWGLHADIWKNHLDKTLKLGREKKKKKSWARLPIQTLRGNYNNILTIPGEK